VALVVLAVAPLAPIALLTRQIYLGVAPLWLVPRGKYARARRCYEQMLRGPFARLFASTRQACAYGVALCQWGEREVERALASLRALPYEALPPQIRLGVSSLLTGTLLLLERDATEAAEHARRALALLRAPDLLLALAHARRSLDDVAGAERAAAEASACPREGLVMVGARAILFRPAAQVEASTDLMQGWYLVRRGRPEEARPLLERAARSTLLPPMLEKARALLAQCAGAPAVAELPPSLAPYELTR
jgi:tetratricopeptide (TPR) repeat protein